MNRREQLEAEINTFEVRLGSQKEKLGLARANLATTQAAIQRTRTRTRTRTSKLTLKESEELDNALKNSHEEVSKVITSIIAMEGELKSLLDLLARLPA